MHAKSGLRVFLEWKIDRPDSVITAVIPLGSIMKTHFSLLVLSTLVIVTGCTKSLEDWCVVCGMIGCQKNGLRELDIEDWKKYCKDSNQVSAAIESPQLSSEKYGPHDQVYQVDGEPILILSWHWSPDHEVEKIGAATVLALEKNKPLADKIGIEIASELNVQYKPITP